MLVCNINKFFHLNVDQYFFSWFLSELLNVLQFCLVFLAHSGWFFMHAKLQYFAYASTCAVLLSLFSARLRHTYCTSGRIYKIQRTMQVYLINTCCKFKLRSTYSFINMWTYSLLWIKTWCFSLRDHKIKTLKYSWFYHIHCYHAIHTCIVQCTHL